MHVFQSLCTSKLYWRHITRCISLALLSGLPVAIATGGSRPQVTKSLTAVGLLEGYFDAIVTANDVTFGKPHPETFLRAAELIGVDPKHCVG
jgi:HAD superfamily hydrolase (TIGR01549 family)